MHGYLWIDMRAPTALKMSGFCCVPNHGNMLLAFEREETVIFEQDHASGSDLAGQLVMSVHIELTAFWSFFGLENDGQDATNRFIESSLAQLAGTDGFDDSLDAAILRAGHFQIESTHKGSHAIRTADLKR
jgi:hypothetical protein